MVEEGILCENNNGKWTFPCVHAPDVCTQSTRRQLSFHPHTTVTVTKRNCSKFRRCSGANQIMILHSDSTIPVIPAISFNNTPVDHSEVQTDHPAIPAIPLNNTPVDNETVDPIGSWPWVIGIYSNNIYECLGVLIDYYYVLADKKCINQIR